MASVHVTHTAGSLTPRKSATLAPPRKRSTTTSSARQTTKSAAQHEVHSLATGTQDSRRRYDVSLHALLLWWKSAASRKPWKYGSPDPTNANARSTPQSRFKSRRAMSPSKAHEVKLQPTVVPAAYKNNSHKLDTSNHEI